jgi:hypothetical protein
MALDAASVIRQGTRYGRDEAFPDPAEAAVLPVEPAPSEWLVPAPEELALLPGGVAPAAPSFGVVTGTLDGAGVEVGGPAGTEAGGPVG